MLDFPATSCTGTLKFQFAFTAGASGKPPGEEVPAAVAPATAPPGFVPLPEGQPTVRVDTSQPPPLRPEMGKLLARNNCVWRFYESLCHSAHNFFCS